MPAPKAANPTALAKSGALLRGEALIAEVIRFVETGKAKIEIPSPRPIPAATLAKLTFVGGAKLPPSLLRWLAFDGVWWMQTLHHFHDLERPSLQPISLAALVIRELDDSPEYASVYAKLDDTPFRGPVLRLGSPSNGHVLGLHLGVADKRGEYPVLDVDGDDMPRVTLRYPGLDVWLAERAGLIGSKERKLVAEALGDHAGRYDGAFSAELQASWRGLDAKKKTVWEGEEIGMEPYVDAEPADVAEGEAPDFPITKPVPKLSEDRLSVQLVNAIEKQQPARVEWLLTAALERFPSGAWRNDALLRACRHGPARLVSRLLAAGANPNPVGDQDDAPLEWAANPWDHKDAVAIARLLLDAGADVNGSTSAGNSPMDTAILRSQPRVLEVLIERGADLSRLDKHKQTLLHHAASGGRDETEECAKLLLQAGAVVDPVDVYGQTPLLNAVYERKKRATALTLLKAGADPNLGKGESPFLRAFMSRDRELLEAMRPRADLARKHEHGWSVAELAGDDILLPKRFEVAYSPSAERQTLTLAIEVRSLEELDRSIAEALPTTFDGALRAFARVLSDGGYEEGGKAEVTSKPPARRSKPAHSLEWTVNVQGLSAQTLFAALARWQTLVRSTFLSAFSVRGDAPLVGADVVDDRRAAAWWRSPPAFRTHGPLPFATSVNGPKMRAVIEIEGAKKHQRALDAVLDAWNDSFEVNERFRGEPKLVVGAKSATMTWRDHDARQPNVDAAFAVLFGLLAKTHAGGAPITRVSAGLPTLTQQSAARSPAPHPPRCASRTT